ncbi:hypothetical protein WG68_18260 [Arsukibacterium ikkense]|uniref:Bacterial surface antigen (D15) domain-containing protein n=1 Tax=Arsukibacterium ikkense TaxID=336831 RepID=A0A0M2V053_9GAMM|nr:PD40 domain-containing protein [Arsukibacterium ikkense]KKO43951.1 hypothetical protein WG68_18260 [Arsukibacterium ikkense]
MLPYNQIRLYLFSPQDVNSLENFDNWLALLLTHEYTHTLHLDKARGASSGLRKVFGRGAGFLPLFLYPNSFQPTFMLEGLAILKESADGQSGRLNSNYYKMLIADEARYGSMDLGYASHSGSYSYLYGAFFYQFLLEQYNAEKVQQLIEAYSGKIIPYRISATSKQVFGVRMPLLWQQYQQWLVSKFGDTPELTQGELVDASADNLAFYTGLQQPPVARGALVWRQVHDGHAQPYLAAYDNNRNELKRISTERIGIFDVNALEHVVITQQRYRADNRLYSDLYLYTNNAWRQLTYKGRYTETRWWGNDKLIAKRQHNGRGELVVLDTDGRLLQTLWQAAPDQVIGRFTVSVSQGLLVAAIQQQQQGYQLYQLNLADGRWLQLTQGTGIKQQPQFSADGLRLVYTSDQDGQYNIYQLDFSETVLKQQQLTKVSSGAFNPTLAADGALWFEQYQQRTRQLLRLPGSDFAEAQLLMLAPQLVSWDRSEKPALPETILLPATPYQATGSLWPTGWQPGLSVNNDATQLMLQTFGQDALGRHQYQLLAGIDSKAESLFGQFSYQYSNTYSLYLEREIEHYSLQQQIYQSIATDRFSFYRLNAVTGWDDKLNLHAGLVSEQFRELYRDHAQLADGYPGLQATIAGVALLFNNCQQFYHNNGPSRGRRLLVSAEANGLGSDFSGNVYRLNWREYFHLGQSHVLQLKLAGSYGNEHSRTVRLGGDSASEPLLATRRYALRGYADNLALSGKHAAIASLQWNIPLADLQWNYDTFPLGVNRIYAAAFAEHGRLWRRSTATVAEEQLSGVGIELTTEFTVGYRLTLPVTLGLARGLDDTYGENRAYLNINLAVF